MKATGKTGLLLIALAAISWTLEKLLYGGRLDASNTVQESFFLPLGYMLAAAGILALVVAGALLMHHRWRSTRQARNRRA